MILDSFVNSWIKYKRKWFQDILEEYWREEKK